MDKLQKQIEKAIIEEKGSNSLISKQKEILNDRIESSNLTPEEKQREKEKINSITTLEDLKEKEVELNKALDNQVNKDIQEAEKAIENEILNQNTENKEAKLLEAKKDVLKEKINSATNLSDSQKAELLSQVDETESLDDFSNNKAEIEKVLNYENQKSAAAEIAKQLDKLTKEAEKTLEDQIGLTGLANKRIEDLKESINSSNLPNDKKEQLINSLNSINPSSEEAFNDITKQKDKINKELELQSVKDEALKVANRLSDSEEKQALIDSINNGTTSDIEAAKEAVATAKQKAEEKLTTALNEAKTAINKLAGADEESSKLNSELINASTEEERKTVKAKAEKIVNDKILEAKAEVEKLDDTNPKKQELLQKISKAEADNSSNYSTFNELLKEAQSEESKEEEKKKAQQELDSAENISEEDKRQLANELNSANDMDEVIAKKDEIIKKKEYTDSKKAASDEIANIENETKRSELQTLLNNAETKAKADEIRAQATDYKNKELANKQKAQELRDRINALQTQAKKEELLAQLESALNKNGQPNSNTEEVKNALTTLANNVDSAVSNEQRVSQDLEVKKQQLRDKITQISDTVKKAEYEKELERINSIADPSQATTEANTLDNKVTTQKAFETKKAEAQAEINRLRTKDSAKKTELQSRLDSATTEEQAATILQEAQAEKAREDEQIEAKRRAVNEALGKLQDGTEFKNSLVSRKDQAAPSDDASHRTVDLAELDNIVTAVNNKIEELKNAAKAAIALANGLEATGDNTTSYESLNADVNNEANQTEEKLNELKQKAQAEVAKARNAAIDALGQSEGKELSNKKKALQQLINDPTKTIADLNDLLNKVNKETKLETKAAELIAKANKIQDPQQRQSFINRVNNLMNSDNESERTTDKLQEIENEISSSNERQEAARTQAYTDAKAAIDSISDSTEKQRLLTQLKKADSDEPKDELTASEIQDIKNAAEAFKNFEDKKREAREKLALLPTGNTIRTTKEAELDQINSSESNSIARIEQIKQAAETELNSINNAVTEALRKVEELVDHEEYASIKQKIEQKDSDNNEVDKIQTSGNNAQTKATEWKAAKASLTEFINQLPAGNAEKTRIDGVVANKDSVNNVNKVTSLIAAAQAEKTKLTEAISEVKSYIDQQLPTNAKVENTVASEIIAKISTEISALIEEVNEVSKISALKQQIDSEKQALDALLSQARESYKALPEGNSVKVKHSTSMADNYYAELVNNKEKVTAIKNELETEKSAIETLKQDIIAQLNNSNLKETHPRKVAIKKLIDGQDVDQETHPKEQREFETLKNELITLNNDLSTAKTQAQAEINKLPEQNTERVRLQALLDAMNNEHDEVSEINSKIKEPAIAKATEFASKYQLIQTALQALPNTNPKYVEIDTLITTANNKLQSDKLREISQLETIESELKQLKTDLDNAARNALDYLGNRLPLNNDVRTNITNKINTRGADADEVSEISETTTLIDNEESKMNTAISSLRSKLEHLPSNYQYRIDKTTISNVPLKDQTILLNESNITDLINEIENTEIPKVDAARMTVEFDEEPSNAKFSNVPFTLETSNLNDSVTDNKLWASVDRNVLNVLPKLEENQIYKKVVSTDNEEEVTKTTTVGSEGETIYNLYQDSQKIKSFIIFCTPQNNINFESSMITRLQGSSQIGTKAEWSRTPNNIGKLVDNNYGGGSRYEAWGDYNIEQNNNNFVIYKKDSNNREENAWYARMDLFVRFTGGSSGRYDHVVPREVRISFSDDGQSWENVQNQSHVFDYDWFKEERFNRNNGTISLFDRPDTIKDNNNNGFNQFAQLYGDQGSHNTNANNVNQVVRIRTNFTPINAKYIRVSWVSAINPQEVRNNATGLKVTAWTEVKPYILTTSGLDHFKANETKSAFALPSSLNVSYNGVSKVINGNGEDYIDLESSDNTLSASNIQINNKEPELSYSISKIKSFKFSSNSSKEVYSEFLITVKNAINEIKTFKVGIGKRPINTDLVGIFAESMNESTNDPKGTVRRLLKDIERWTNGISQSSELKWNDIKEPINQLKTTISDQNYQLNTQELQTWWQLKNLIININRENSSTDNTETFENKLNEVRTKWAELLTLQPANLEDLYTNVHQPMMNDLSKTLDDLNDHLKWIQSEIDKLSNPTS
ncbi:Uncharacterised protein [Mycoplasmopsis maculosa]|uniref:Uncharacterized protein n=1 Tax=Mycoplasmopsis maculosa TaxID=114885 RepID=A0A449B523_9BACT|nr:hypothetical protein [Mycoplasmopsis maculosa]VEU75701.1 Uncharacterised protein [Mycoplasmopsis maculosa]